MKQIKLAGWTLIIPSQLNVNQHQEIRRISLDDVEVMTDDEWNVHVKALKKGLALAASAIGIGLVQNGQKPVKRSNRKRASASKSKSKKTSA